MKTKENVLQRICVLLLLISILMTGCAKGKNKGDETVEFVDLNGYTIIRRLTESRDVINAVSSFYTELKDQCKLNVAYGVDEEVDAQEKEILIGKTNRSEDKNHRYSDFSVEYKDGKIYVCGGSAEAIKAATEWMLPTRLLPLFVQKHTIRPW